MSTPVGGLRMGLGLVLVAGPLALSACRQASSAPVESPASPEQCEAGKRDLLALLEHLPARALAAPTRVPLPESLLGRAPGSGPVLELDARSASFDSEPLPGGTLAERVEALRVRAAGLVSGDVFVAAAPDVDVRTLRAHLSALPESLTAHLLVRTRAARVASDGSTPGDTGAAATIAAELLAERDPGARAALARDAYQQFSRCDAVAHAVASVEGKPHDRRWPALRGALLEAVPRCACGELDATSLKQVVVAEQRAGTMTLATLPASFLRDVRCEASMPLRSVQKLLRQIEDFDQEFAGSFGRDEVRFEDVVTNERLLNVFCNALPGETLASVQRAHAHVYFRPSDGSPCEPWQFEPLSPGAPMGTWRRVSGAPLAFHYWQAAEAIRLFGPVPDGAPSKPTDTGPWSCDETKKLVGVDATSVALEQGRL